MITPTEIAIRLTLAAVLGAVIGFNRGHLAWRAGLRTHMLVAVGSALVIIVSTYGFEDILKHPNVILDPSRIAAQVVSGIGFLGAGTILFMPREKVVRGLTTAAGLWAVAAVGLAAGSGLYVAGIMATVLMWVILAALKPLERRFLVRQGDAPARLLVRLDTDTALATLEAVIGQHRLPVAKMMLTRQDNGEDLVAIRFAGATAHEQLLRVSEALRHTDGIKSVTLDTRAG